jgi:hypothetical protein
MIRPAARDDRDDRVANPQSREEMLHEHDDP